MSSLARLTAKIRSMIGITNALPEHLDQIKLNQGIMLTALNDTKQSTILQDYEFKVFSQWGEDGIIQHLVRSLPIAERTFIEFGVEDFSESNCRFLMIKDDWRGFVIDGSPERIARLRRSPYYWKYDLNSVAAFITRENINELLAKSGFGPDLGILSVDIDGNDYHVLEAIEYFRPRILISEYNAVFGGERKITVPYDPCFVRTQKHYSNLYFGASLPAITYLAQKRGYTLVGTDSARVNAFFVRNDLMSDKFVAWSAAEAYQPSHMREGRDAKGALTYLEGDGRLKAIAGMPVFNVESQQIESL